MRMPITKDLREWARVYRRVRSTGVADLLEAAADALDAGETNALLATELLICAAAREHLPEQQSAADLMAEAAERLLPKSGT